jgi:hypothetical protein
MLDRISTSSPVARTADTISDLDPVLYTLFAKAFSASSLASYLNTGAAKAEIIRS